MTLAASTARTLYWRKYIYIASAPSALATILLVLDNAAAALASIRMNSDRTLELWNENAGTQIGSDSAALNTATWYFVELAITVNGSNQVTDISARIDGAADFAAASGLTVGYTAGGTILRVGAVTSTTCDLYFDDIGGNDSTGSAENSYPGEEYLIALRPASAGDNADCTRGGADSGSDFGQVDEVTPNDLTDYLILAANGDIVDLGVEDPVAAGIGSGDTVKFVATYSRLRGASASLYAWNHRVKSASGGTVLTGPNSSNNNTAFENNLNSLAIAYTDPTTGVAWTVTGTNSITNAQVGLIATDAAPDIWVTTFWAYVAYTPAAPGGATYPGADGCGVFHHDPRFDTSPESLPRAPWALTGDRSAIAPARRAA